MRFCKSKSYLSIRKVSLPIRPFCYIINDKYVCHNKAESGSKTHIFPSVITVIDDFALGTNITIVSTFESGKL